VFSVITEDDLYAVADAMNTENFDISVESTLSHFYNAYSMMPSSKLDELSSQIVDNNMIYLGRDTINANNDNFVRELYATKESFVEVLLQKDSVFNGDVKFIPIEYSEVFESLGIYEPAAESIIEDLTKATAEALGAADIEPLNDFDFVMEADLNTATGNNAANNNQQQTNDNSNTNDTGGGGIEDLTKTTSQAMSDSGDATGTDAGANDTANDLAGDDFGDDNNGDTDSPDGLDESEDDSDDTNPDDDGTVAKKRIRKNMLKLHTIIKDSLDAMATFTPAYGIDNAKKYYRIQNTLNTSDEILLRIITEEINNLTVEDLMKKYTTLCNIYDISTRSLHEFAKEYKELADTHNVKNRKRTSQRTENAF
jgi:hypothetical protein